MSLEAGTERADRPAISAQGYVDTARLRSALSDAQAEAETCLASLDGASSLEVNELRRQLHEARDAASSCLVQMGSAAPSDEVCRAQLGVGVGGDLTGVRVNAGLQRGVSSQLSAPVQVWMRAVSTQVEISRLRAAAAVCDPQAVEQAKVAAVREALGHANSASAAALETLLDRTVAAEVRHCVFAELSSDRCLVELPCLFQQL